VFGGLGVDYGWLRMGTVLMLVTWHVLCDFSRHESMAHNPYLGWNDSLAFVGIESFLFILIVNLLAGIWGYYGGCVYVGSGSLFSILGMGQLLIMCFISMRSGLAGNVTKRVENEYKNEKHIM
jgi:hypothetical protein